MSKSNSRRGEQIKPYPRDTAVDIIKCIAVFGVIIIHSVSYNYDIGSFNWYIAVFWGSLVRSSVPLFFMCSGVLFLGRGGLSVKKLFIRSILRIVAAMLVWAAAYKIYHLILSGSLTPASAVQGIKEVLVFNQEFHFYYLHIILMVYLLLPVTELIAGAADKRRLEYILGLWFVFGIVYPSVSELYPFSLLRGIPLQYKINMCYSAVGYGILGFYMKKYPPRRYVCAILAVLGFLSIFIGTAAVSVKHGELYTGFFEGMSPGVCLFATGLFGIIYSVKDNVPKKLGTVAEYGSRASFCVYLAHMFFVYQVRELFAGVLPAVKAPVIAAVVMILCLAVYFVLSHIPWVKRWLV